MAGIVVMCTANTPELAQRIAKELIEAGEAACVSIAPGLRSIYRWENRICEDSELLLLIKTGEEHFERVRATIRRVHSYQVPEIIALPIAAGDSAYMDWLFAQLRQLPAG